jgi:hypothetical protein
VLPKSVNRPISIRSSVFGGIVVELGFYDRLYYARCGHFCLTPGVDDFRRMTCCSCLSTSKSPSMCNICGRSFDSGHNIVYDPC